MTNWAHFWQVHHRRIIVVAGVIVMLGLTAWLLKGRLTEPIDSYAACVKAGYPVMESDPPACAAGGRTFVGPRTSPTPTPEVGEAQEFQLLVEGDSGGAYPQRQEIITTQTAWQRYWTGVHANIKPAPPILPVDFTTSNVVALSTGQKPTTGYNLKITGIFTTSAGTTVDVTEQAPDGTCMLAQKITNRYLIVRTPKLKEPVSFRTSAQKRSCK
jgi:hypothetical protein